MSCSVALSKSPVLTPSHHHHHNHTSSLFIFRQNIAGDKSESDAPVVKRKRPAKLDIPASFPVGFGEPVTPRPPENGVVEEERDGFYSVYCKRGRRPSLEDRFSALLHFPDYPNQALFGVFDGHGGVEAANFSAKNLGQNIMDEVSRTNDSSIADAVKQGYLRTDFDFLKQNSPAGTCCVTALITEGNLVVSNAGDCRAVICRGGVAEALTTDHRPSRQDEKDRIEAKGGYIDCYNGVWRIQGSLAVSRAIGNKQLKQWVIAEPETKIIRMKPDDEFLILASDGLWDKVTDQEAVDIARPLCTGNDKLQPAVACKKLVDTSVARASLDDISVMLIQLKSYIQ